MADESRPLTAEEREIMGLAPDEAAPEVRLHPVLSNEEYREAQLKARSRVIAHQKKAATKDVEEREIRRLRMEEGLTVGSKAADEIVTIVIDLPIWAPYINLDMTNGTQYWHGQTYTVPRHKADTLRDMMSRQWRLDDEIEGRSLAQHYGTKRNVVMNAVTGEQSSKNEVVYDA